MKEMITVEKEVYEAVLRNSIRVSDLEAENQQLKELLRECEEVLLSYSNMDGDYELYDKITNAIGE